MGLDSLKVELTQFFKTARHLWGRCPRCNDLFRLSEAAISFGSDPPADWLRRLQRQQAWSFGRAIETGLGMPVFLLKPGFAEY